MWKVRTLILLTPARDTGTEPDFCAGRNEIISGSDRICSSYRYPGLYEPVTEAEYREALAMAECVHAWVSKQLR